MKNKEGGQFKYTEAKFKKHFLGNIKLSKTIGIPINRVGDHCQRLKCNLKWENTQN